MMLRSSLSNLMQNTKISTQLLKHFVSTWFEKLPKIVSQNWSVQNGVLRTLRLNKQGDETCWKAARENCFAAIERIDMAKLLDKHYRVAHIVRNTTKSEQKIILLPLKFSIK